MSESERERYIFIYIYIYRDRRRRAVWQYLYVYIQPFAFQQIQRSWRSRRNCGQLQQSKLLPVMTQTNDTFQGLPILLTPTDFNACP